MRILLRYLTPLSGALIVALSACRQKADVKARAAELEAAFPAAGSNSYVSLALSAVHTNDYAVGVIALQTAQRMPGATAGQLMAVRRTMEAMTADLVQRASRGDPQAKAALAIIEKSRSQ